MVQKHLQLLAKVRTHKDATAARISRDEVDVLVILLVLQESFVDLFSSQPVLSISTVIEV